MRIHVLSDLHLEFAPFTPPEVDADVVVLAGDIWLKNRGVKWANEAFSQPVIYVCGNHEFYGDRIDRVYRECRSAAAGHVHVLERESIEIGGYRFLGATLWTDFELFGEHRRIFAMLEANQNMTVCVQRSHLAASSEVRYGSASIIRCSSVYDTRHE